ncbi:MAG TPA: glycosyltransferase family 2 protein [Solirubrobacteraceae bacterium]|nr:glycosyltransferase family 2 protein [Solirubrobacteraceae bacterium]
MSETSQRRLDLLSVVVPVFNEAETLAELHRRVCAALAGLPFELLLVDDGSDDGSAQTMRELAASDPRVKAIFLARNFGHQLALTAGLDHACGDAVVMMDADLQDPPELILEMLARWRTGSDVVYAVREQRAGESWFKLATARWFYRVFDSLTNVDLVHNAGDFRLLDRHALDALLSMRERSRFLRGMTVWVGYTQSAVPYQRDARYAGKTKFTLGRMLAFSLDAISGFSHRPLQVATLLGFLISALALVAIPVVIALKLVGSYLPGFSTVEISMLLLGGIQLITIGIIGEYVGRIHDEVKGRPLYLVRGTVNLEAAGGAGARPELSAGGVGTHPSPGSEPDGI